MTTRPCFVFPPRVLAEVDEVGLQPVVRALGSRLAQRTWPGPLHLPAHVGLQRLEGHGLHHVEVTLPCKSVQLPGVPHVEVVGQRLHVYLFFGPPLGLPGFHLVQPGLEALAPRARW